MRKGFIQGLYGFWRGRIVGEGKSPRDNISIIKIKSQSGVLSRELKIL